LCLRGSPDEKTLEAKSMTNLPEEKNQNCDTEPASRRPWVKPTLECLSLKEALNPSGGNNEGVSGS
jgi:hypothetical protein